VQWGGAGNILALLLFIVVAGASVLRGAPRPPTDTPGVRT
jgi:hypothetical protein